MAKNNNVETHKKNAKIENEKSRELKPKETTKKNKLRLHSHLKVNIPLSQSLMMILPSLAKHAAAEDVGSSGDTADQLTANSVAKRDVNDDHTKADSSAVALQEAQTSNNDVNSTLSASHAAHGSSSHLVPSHHLSTLSHPQVHYIPSVSMPTISAGGNGQPTHSNTPPTPTTPVTFIPEVIKGTYGELHVDVNGQYTFVLNPNSPQYILLNQHQQGTDHFALHLSNGASIIVQIPVTGKQDLPSISGDLTGVVTEDHNIDSQGLLHANGKIDVVDPDQNESSVTPEVISGKYGSLTIDANGHWQYQVDNSFSNVQALTGATSLHESFTIHTKDGTPQTIDMTIGGNDDNAVITGMDAGSVIEDLTTQVQGQLSVTDPDLGEDHFQASQVNGHLGTLTIDKNGAWTYDLDNTNPTVQALGKGATATDIITVHSADGTAHQVTITINGTNDKAVIGGTSSGAVTEESQLQTSGTLTITDVDTGEAHFSNTDVAGTLGTLHLKDNGAWTYDLDNTNPAVQALGKGSATTDIMTIHSADGTPHQITIIINGTNDRAVIGGTSSGAVTEETQLQTSGALTITDVDTGEAHFSNTDVAGALGTLHLKDNGAWTYDLDNTNPKVQALGKGSTATDTITVHSAEGTPHQITVTVNGTNDRPSISGTSSGAVIEQGLSTTGNPDATGSLIATDIDKSDTVTWAINQPQGQWGTLSIDQHGHWHYQLDNSTGGAADKLAAGEHKSESFWITATDSAGATVTHKVVIDVQGSNDKPIVSSWTQLPAGKEDQPITINASDLLAHASDVDNSDILHVTNLQATNGSLVDNKDGTYTFTPDKDFNGEIRLTYEVVDGHGGSVSTQAKFDLTAAPDNAIITDAQTNAGLRGVTEDRGYIDTHYQLHYDGKLNIQDPDAGEAQFDPNIGPQTYQGIGYDTKLGGHILLMRDGHYTYTLDNRNIQNLAQGEVKHDSAVIRSADGTTHTIELTVHGTNDAPTINAQSHSVTEGGSVLNGQMVGHDIDTGAALTYSAPQTDGLLMNPDGSYSFDPSHSSYQSLASGALKTLTIPVTVTDEHHASSTQPLTITITGTNNLPVIGGVDFGDINENQAGVDRSPVYAHPGDPKLFNDLLTVSGDLTINDADSGESHFQHLNGGTPQFNGTYGHLYIQENGHWVYVVNVGDSGPGRAIDALGKGDKLTDTITVHTQDGTSHDIVITIHGDNDRPYCSSEVQLNSGKEDLAQTITTADLLANTVDVDANDAGKLTIANLHANHGSIQDNQDGTFTFTPDKDYNGQVHFTYDVQDAHGGTTHTGANTTLAATPDKAIISEVTTGSVIEDGPHATHNNGTTTELANGQLQVIDPDSGEDKFQYSQFGETAVHDPFGGMLRIDSAGTWGYSVDNAALQHLAQGQVETVTYRVHSFDGTAYDLNIDVVGTNDAPTVTKVVLSNGTEDTHYQMQASQFGFTDVDTGDMLHSIAITDLPPAAQGKFVLDGHDITAGQSIPAAEIAKLQFIPATDFNGDVQFKFTVNDGHVDSQEATNTLHINAVKDAAQISGVDTADVDEGHGSFGDMSPDYAQPGMAKLGQAALTADGKLNIVDPDSGEAQFDPKGGAWNNSYHGQYGHLILNTDGTWHYDVTVGNVDWVGNRKSTVGTTIDQLGEGQTLTDTITVQSKDGTTHDIVITIHGDNDRPYCSSEVQLNSGKEDLAQTITTAELLANTVDVDANDAGQLSIANLRTAHGTLVDNKDGTFTFTPEHNYNGQVHFTYDVKDAHGGFTHTGASTTLLSINDAATVSSATISVDEIDSAITTSGTLTSTDVDNLNNAFTPDSITGTIGDLTIDANGHWTFTANSAFNQLNVGDKVEETFTVTTIDGTPSTIKVTINGTNDAPILNVQEQSFNDDNHQSIDMTLPANLFIDPEGDAIAYSLEMVTTSGVSSLPSWLTFDPSTLKLTGTPPPEVSGDFDIRVTATDSHGASNHEDFHIAVQQLEGDVKEDGRAQNHQLDATGQLDAYHNGQHIVWHMKADGSDSLNHADGQYGHLSVSTGGTWHYVIDHDGDAHYSNSDLNALRGGQVVPDSFTLYGYQNGQLVRTETIHIQVEGTNDKPAIRGISSLTTDENSIVSGKLDITDVDTGESFFNHQTISSTYGEFVIEKDGNWHFSPNQLAQSLTSIDSVVDTVEISSVDGTKHSLSVTVNGLDQPVLNVTDISIQVNEDSPHTFTAAEFSTDNYDQLTISSLPDAAHGTLTLNRQPVTAGQHIAPAQIGQLVFTPTHNYHGDATFGFSVSENGVQSSAFSGHVTVDSVTDAASIRIQTASDAVMQTEQGHGLAVGHLDGSHLSDGNGQTSITAEIVVRMKSGSNTNPDAVILQFGRAAAKGTMMNNPVALEEHTGDGSYYGTHHGFSVTNPQNLTLWIPGHMPIQTGIDTTTDSGTHRYTFTVDTASHSATVFEDGAQAFHTDSAQIWHWIADLQGTRVRLSGEFAGDDSVLKGEGFLLDSTPRGSLQHYPKFIAERMGDNGLNLGDGLHPLGNNKHEIMGSDGQMHAAGGDLSVDAKFSSAVIVQGSVTAGQVAAGPLNAQTPGLGDDKVLLDLGVQGGQIVDHTGHQSNALEHHSLNSPLIGGDPLHHELNLDVQATDPDDHVTSVKLTGLPDGTMLDDGHGHTATVQKGQAIDVQDWNRASIGVVLPNTAPTGDVSLHVEVTTTGPDGATTTSSADNTSMHVSDVMTDTAPDIIQSIMLGDEDQTYHFSEQDFGYSDKDGDPLDHVTITQLPDPAHGQLLINGHAVTAGQKIPVYDIGNMLFQPAKDFNGDVDFQYSVSDGLKDSAPSQGTLTIAPVVDVTIELASTSDSGSSNTDNLTNDATPTITGHTDIPYSQVTIYDGSTPVGSAVSDASGQYSVTVSNLTEGVHNLSAKALTPSSGLSATSSLLSVHIDTQVHVGIQMDPVTADNVINAQESNSSVNITGAVSGDFSIGDIVTLEVNGAKHTGTVDAKGHYSIAVPGSELIADADQQIEVSIAVTDSAGNSAHAVTNGAYQIDKQVNLPTITFENPGADGLYSKAEIAHGQPNTVTATITPPGDAKIGEHLIVNGQDHVLDAHILQHGLQVEVRPGSQVQATMTDEHGNTAGSQSMAASAIPEPIVVKPPSGSHQVSGTLGVPPLVPSQTPVPSAQNGWRIHLPNGQYVTSHHGQYGTLTIDPQTGHLHYQEQAQFHTGPHGSASGIGQHEDRFEIALQGTNQDEVVAHVNIQILSHGPGHSGKLTVGTEVVDMTITPIVPASHPAPPPPPVQHDEPEIASHEDFTFTVSEDTSLDLSQHAHQEPGQKTDHHGASAYLDALGIQPNASPTTGHDQPADMDIVLAQVDQQHAADYDQTHLDMSDALEHHDAANNHNQDDEHHHHHDLDGLPDIDPNN
ncbi:VCBS domain-containing protein [Vibrio chagasii]|uniref:VCBS domain-containing protein n=1 Tax=Vibrio chagasii TaxID=170679 RepID=UPI0038CD6FB6